MSSDLIVDVCEIKEVKSHPNADKLELAIVKGWQVCIPKGQYKTGDIAVYCPPDAMLPLELADKLGVTQYLSIKKEVTRGRVKAVRLRGEMSFGFLFDGNPIVKDFYVFEVGDIVTEVFDITKYEPPMKITAGDQDSDHPLFFKYTDIQNWRNFPDLIKDGEEVVISEKIHGSNVRVGLVDGEFMVGSHNTRKKLDSGSIYQLPLTENVKGLLNEISKANEAKSVILFGEIYGAGIQDLKYGELKEPKFRAFDIFVDGIPWCYESFSVNCFRWNIETVPQLFVGSFLEEKMKELATGNTTLMSEDAHVKEGVVIKPVEERHDSSHGRVILKFINDDYFLRKGTKDNPPTENH